MPTSGHYNAPCLGDGCPPVLDPLAIGWSAAWWAGDIPVPPGSQTDEWLDMVTGVPQEFATRVGSIGPTITEPPALNYRPALTFGVDVAMDAAITTSVGQPLSIVQIMVLDPGREQRWVIADNGDIALFSGLAGGTVLFAGATFVTGLTAPLGSAILSAAVYDNANSRHWVNGVESNVGFAGAYDIGTSVSLIGGDTQFEFGGSIAFVGLYPGDVTLDPAWMDFVVQASYDYNLGV